MVVLAAKKGGKKRAKDALCVRVINKCFFPFPLSPFPRDLRLERYRRHKLLIAMTEQGGKERGKERGGDAMRI